MTAAADADTELLEDTAARRRATLRRYARHPAFVCGAIGVVLLVLVAVFAPWLAPHPPTRTDLMNTLSPPSATYWLGTDAFGRCVLSRLVWGTRISLQVGLYVVLRCGDLHQQLKLVMPAPPPGMAASTCTRALRR